jgi:hypothetical protein
MFLRTGGDTPITNGSYYEPLVISISNGFNDTGGNRGIGDRSICSSDLEVDFQQMISSLASEIIGI